MIADQLQGKRFGRLTVLRDGRSQTNKIVWICACECGKESQVRGGHLKSGSVVSCGCYAADKARSRATHGKSRTTTHVIWKTMRARCNNPKSSGFAGYGARGIKVCNRWNNFEHFFADMGERPEGMSIERIDNEKGYEPGNCKWATNGEQCRNRRSTHLIVYQGETKCRKDWSAELGISAPMLQRRIAKLGIDAAFESFKRERNDVV